MGEVRGLGAFFGIELVKDKKTREPLTPWQGTDPGPLPRLQRQLLEHGVYVFGRYNVLIISPPLVVERSDLMEGLDTVERALLELQRAA